MLKTQIPEKRIHMISVDKQTSLYPGLPAGTSFEPWYIYL